MNTAGIEDWQRTTAGLHRIDEYLASPLNAQNIYRIIEIYNQMMPEFRPISGTGLSAAHTPPAQLREVRIFHP